MTDIKMVKSKLNGEFELILPEHRANRPDWHNEQGWEKARLQEMHKQIGKGDIVYYVGTELGEMAALCSKWGAEVVLIEPNWSAWPSIYQTWVANKLKQPLYCFAGFASNKNQVNPPNPDMALLNGIGFINDGSGWPHCAFGEIIKDHGFSELASDGDGLPQIKIDYLNEKINAKPTVIIFDVEGSEWEVMKGAEETLKKHHPKIFASIHPEFMYKEFGQYSTEFRGWLKGFGYKEKILDYQHELHTYYE